MCVYVCMPSYSFLCVCVCACVRVFAGFTTCLCTSEYLMCDLGTGSPQHANCPTNLSTRQTIPASKHQAYTKGSQRDPCAILSMHFASQPRNQLNTVSARRGCRNKTNKQPSKQLNSASVCVCVCVSVCVCSQLQTAFVFVMVLFGVFELIVILLVIFVRGDQLVSVIRCDQPSTVTQSHNSDIKGVTNRGVYHTYTGHPHIHCNA